MALITQFEARPLTPRRLHQPVICGYAQVDIHGRRVLQLETYGSPDRQIPDKVSQSIQLDENAARVLKRLLEGAFPDL